MGISINNIRFSYDQKNDILKGITLSIPDQQCIALIGQNGSGKTTLVKHLNGILKPYSGDILIDGESVISKTTAQLAVKVGYVFQNPDDQLFLSTIKKELEFGPDQIGMAEDKKKEMIQIASKLCGLTEFLDKHPLDLGASVKKFCTIAAILAMDTDIVIFDEPTMGQDRKGIQLLEKILSYLRSKGKICIIISHDMKFVARNFERIVVLNQGKIILDGTAQEVFDQPDILKKSFVNPPPITRVCQKCGINKSIFEINDFRDYIEKTRVSRFVKR